MSDLELVKACAEAMEPTWSGVGSSSIWAYSTEFVSGTKERNVRGTYNPLNNDAQAMELVKKMELWIQPPRQGHLSSPPHDYWLVAHSAKGGDSRNADLNRAICECVAKLRTPA
jgi:hypothetical protein